MTAERLRDAAMVLDELAAARTDKTRSLVGVKGVWLNSAHYLTTTPEIVLALADWLRYTASIVTEGDDEAADDGCDCPYCIGVPKALAVADAILGTDA